MVHFYRVEIPDALLGNVGLYGESSECLRKLMQGLRRQYEEEIGAETRRGKLWI